MRDEEEEALRLQREQAAALRPEDFGQSSEEEEGSDEEEESGAWWGATRLQGRRAAWVWSSDSAVRLLGEGEGGTTAASTSSERVSMSCGEDSVHVPHPARHNAPRCCEPNNLLTPHSSPSHTPAPIQPADEEGGTLGAAAARAAAAGGHQVAVERVAKDLSALSAEQRLAAVQQDAPELLQLIAELREGLTEVRSRVGPLLKEVRRYGWRAGRARLPDLARARRGVGLGRPSSVACSIWGTMLGALHLKSRTLPAIPHLRPWLIPPGRHLPACHAFRCVRASWRRRRA